jgi:hypothetical protein
MNSPHAPIPTVNLEAVRTHFRVAMRHQTPTATWTAIADIPVLLVELDRVLTLLTRTRTEFANLLAASRATLAAVADDETDPLSYLRDEVAAHRPADVATAGDEAGAGR